MWAGQLNRYSDWLRAGRSGIESRWGRDFPPVQTGPVLHPASCKMGTWSFLGVKCERDVLLTTHPFYCCDHGRVELYLYPPFGTNRACDGITLPLPLLCHMLKWSSDVWQFDKFPEADKHEHKREICCGICRNNITNIPWRLCFK